MGYHLKIQELMDIEEAMLTQLGAWMEQLDAVSRALAPLAMTAAVDGAAGDSIRSFLSEVHQPVAAGLLQAMSDLQVHLLQYADGFYQMEGSHTGDIRQDVLEGTQEGLQRRQGELEDIAVAVEGTLQSIGDIVTIEVPSDSRTKASFEAAVQSLATLNDKIGSHDAAHEQDTAVMKEILDSVRALMNQYGAGGVCAAAYEPGSILGNPMYQHLGEGLQASAAYVNENLSACEEAIGRYGKRWNDRLAEERIEEGFWNALAGVAAVVAGAVLIVATAGTAAPIVLSAAVAGTTSGLYGLSNTAEGLQDIYLGFQGDGTSVAVNPIRDTVFKGNPEMYYTIGNAAMIASAFGAPVIGAGSAAAAAGTSVGRAMLAEGGKVTITGLASCKTSDYVYDKTGSRGLSLLSGAGAGGLTYGGLSGIDKAANLSGLYGRANVSGVGKRLTADKGAGGAGTPKRPSWRQSEINAQKSYPNYEPQKSFKNGQEVPYGTKGSTRPELYKPGHSIEVKNYKVETPSGQNNLVNNVSKQIQSRTPNLPSGTKQTVIVDVRGQTVSNEVLKSIRSRILEKSGIKVEIIFKR